MVLGWLEIPKDDERPPEEIWKDSEAIGDFFASVKEKRDREMQEMRGDRPDESAPLEQNEATRGLKERLAGR
jgi:hypothetical protein